MRFCYSSCSCTKPTAFSAIKPLTTLRSLVLLSPIKLFSIPQGKGSLSGTTMRISECITRMVPSFVSIALLNKFRELSGLRTLRLLFYPILDSNFLLLIPHHAKPSKPTTFSSSWTFPPKPKSFKWPLQESMKSPTLQSAPWEHCIQLTLTLSPLLLYSQL